MIPPLIFLKKQVKTGGASKVSLVLGTVGGVIFGVYAAAMFPNLVRPLIGEEELLTKQEAAIMVADARKNERSKQKPQEVEKTSSALPASGAPAMAPVTAQKTRYEEH